MLQRRVGVACSRALNRCQQGVATSLVRSSPLHQMKQRVFAQSNMMQKRFFLRGAKTSLFKFEGLHVSHATKPLPASMGDPHKHPMIVLIGWLGADLKHLKKYVSWYNERGYDVAYYVPPAFLTLFPFRMGPLCNSIAAALAEHHEFLSERRSKMITIPQDHHLPKNSQKKQPVPPPAPLLFHVFSNNGYFNLCFLLHYIKNGHPDQAYLLDLIKGTIVDSAPSHLTPEVLTRGMIGAFLSKPHDLTYEDAFWTPKMLAFWKLIYKFDFVRKHWDFANSLLEGAHDRDAWPYLFLYSAADMMVLAKETEEHIELLKRHEIHVEAHDFKTSRHVEHLRAFPMEYSSIVESFLGKVAQVNESPQDPKKPTRPSV